MTNVSIAGTPTIMEYGTPEQIQKYLKPMFTAEEIWCQLFSEPGSGSDLASLSTRAVDDGDGYIVNGQKVWTTLGHLAKWGPLVTRTDPEAPKHRVDKSLKQLQSLADKFYILEKGRTVWKGLSKELTTQIAQKYLGV